MTSQALADAVARDIDRERRQLAGHIYPAGAGRYWRPVMLTEAHPGLEGCVWGHRRRDGSHYNTIIGYPCLDCSMERELAYIRALWRHDMARQHPNARQPR
jgi:hypothetical protein